MNVLARQAAPPTTKGTEEIAEVDLVARVRVGDEEAFRVLVERYWERLFRLVLGIVGDWHLSEDVLQEVYVQAHRKLHGFDGRSSLLTWLYRVALNAALKARRRRSRQAFLPLTRDHERSTADPTPGKDLESKDLAQKLLRCLPARMRALLVLREWEGLSYEDIGRVMGISRGAVEQRLHRAMVELRRVWRPALKEEWLHGL